MIGPQNSTVDGPVNGTIGVNLTWLIPGVVGGTEEYIVRHLEAVGPQLATGVTLRLYGSAELARAHPRLAELHRFVTMPEPPGGRAARVAIENSWLARVSAGDLFVHHAGGTVPVVRRVPAIATIHDLQPLEFPANFSAVKRHWLGAALPTVARSARLVMCPSHYSARRVRQLLGVPDDRIRVVPHGHRLPPTATPAVAEQVRAIQADRGRFLLYPAIAYPHKRHVDLVRVLSRLGPDLEDLTVVFTGRPGPETPRLVEEAERLGVAKRVKVLGRIPRHELALLYRAAVALVFPSGYEGFGNPALEAMGLDCPVVASDAGALPEVVGNGGIIYPVGDLAALADAIDQVATRPEVAADLRAAGRRRAAVFDVDIAAEALGAVYREMSDTGL